MKTQTDSKTDFIVEAVNSYDKNQEQLSLNRQYIEKLQTQNDKLKRDNAALLEAAKDACCELDPNCEFDGSNYKGEPSDKGNLRIQTILNLYEIIAQAEGK